MRIKFITLLLLLISQIIFSQSIGELKGKITLDGQPAFGVEITITGNTTIGTTADKNGNYLLKNVPLGEQQIKFSYVTAIPQKRKITIKPSGNKALNIKLESNTQLNEIVVSGTLKPISRMDSPVPVEVYSPTFCIKRNKIIV